MTLTLLRLALRDISRALLQARRAALIGLALLSAGTLQAQGTGAQTAHPESDTPAIVFVHGAFMNAASWDPLREVLGDGGYRTLAVTLPGRSGGPETMPSLAEYRDAVLDAIRAEAKPVLLVGHSFGGITIANVAEAAPGRIAGLVYLAAYLPTDGQSLQMLAGMDRDSRAAAAFVIDGARGVASIAPSARGELFCNDCKPATAAAAAAMMVEEPLAPLGQPAELGQAYAGVRRFYIRTARDRVISPAQQDRMIAASPVEAVLTLDAGHAPMLSQPEALAEMLMQLGAMVAVPKGTKK